MTYINPSGISAYAGIQGVFWWYKRLVKKGAVPLFTQEQLEKASKLPDKHPYHNKLVKTAYITSVVLYVLSMFAFPFIFYLLQRVILKTPEMIFFNNTLSSVLSLFPSLLFAFWVCYFLYLKIGDIWPDYRTMGVYSAIVGANNYLNGAQYNRIHWENLITPAHIKTYKDYEENFFRKATIWCLILTLPIYGFLFFTYSAATQKSIIERSFGATETHQLNDISKITGVLEFKEEKNNGKYELKPRIKVQAIFKDGKTFNMCDFGCSSKTGALVEYIRFVKKTYNVPVEISPLKGYQKELLQTDNPNIFLFYEQLIQIGR